MNFERKKDFQILGEIAENSEKLTKNKEFKIKEINQHKFPDGFIIENNFSRKILSLNYKNEKIAILGFSIKNRKIEIESIQGIKGTNFKHPSNWYQYLLTPFIASSLKVYENKERLAKYIEYRDISSNVLEGKIKELKEILYKKNKHTQSIQLNENKKKYYENELKITNQRLLLTKKIRDDYFTKEGLINLNRKKIINITEKYNMQIERLKQNKRINRLRKNKEIKRIRKK